MEGNGQVMSLACSAIAGVGCCLSRIAWTVDNPLLIT
jgi:hypothetical protein